MGKGIKKKHICESCGFITEHRSNFVRHLNTIKHKNKIIELSLNNQTDDDNTSHTSGFVESIEDDSISAISDIDQKKYMCDCGMCYGHRQSLFKHKQTCKIIKNSNKMLGLSEEKISEIIKKAIDKPSNNYNNYNKCKTYNQNTFNLQLFLNNECKDAITLIEFVSNIKLKLKDLEDTAQNGFVETMTSIMTESLKELDITKRPIHSSDAKRGVMYVKDQDGWEKDKDHSKMTAAIEKVSKSNLRQIPDWVKENPQANTGGTPENDKLMKILEQTINDKTDQEHSKDVEKVIKKVAKSVTIDKEQ
jgi:hypothetical protein